MVKAKTEQEGLLKDMGIKGSCFLGSCLADTRASEGHTCIRVGGPQASPAD